MRHSTSFSNCMGFCLLVSACTDEPLTPEPVEPLGMLSTTLSATSDHDVAAVRYRVFYANQNCADIPIGEKTVTLANQQAANDTASALFVLAPANYRVCVLPLKSDGSPSAECSPTEGTAQVFASATTEVVLISQCLGNHSGGLKGTAVLNDPPRIEDLQLEPGLSVKACQDASLTVTASDPNGDRLTYAWEVVSGNARITANEAKARFIATSPGDYAVRVTVSDVHDATVSLSVPLHVTAGVCAAFQGLGTFGGMSSYASAVSADGSTVTGTLSSSDAYVFRWTQAGGMTNLGRRGRGQAVNSDGSVIAAVVGEGSGAFRWAEVSGWLDLGTTGLPPGTRGSFPTGINADGSVVVGENQLLETVSAFRWTQSSGMVSISGGINWSATATSDDGKVVVGWASTGTGTTTAIRWTESSGPVAFLGDACERSSAQAISGDGLVIVGYDCDGTFYWTEASGIVHVPSIGSASATNANGSVIVGELWTGNATIWDPAHGTRFVSTVLEEFGFDLSGWRLTGAIDVSADGRTIVGNGNNPQGEGEAWIVRLP